MSTRAHPVTAEEIMAMLDGELAPDRMQSASAHMESCSECRELAETLRGTFQLLSDWTIPPQAKNSKLDSALTDAAGRASSTFGAANVPRLVPFFRRHWILTATSTAVATAAFLVFTLVGTMGLRSPQATRQWAGVNGGQAVDLARTNDQIGSQGISAFNRPQMAGADSLSRAIGPSGSSGTLGKLQERIGVERQLEGPKSGEGQRQPMIARTISLSIVAKDFSTSRASLDVILMRHHGYAASLAVSTEQDSARSLQASLRIPAAELNAALAELKSLGRVQNETQNGEEVTQQHEDLVARLKNSRETELRLQDILRNRTGKISDVLAVEQEIARVRGEIEQMEAEQKNLEHRVDFATVDLRLSEEYKAQLGSPLPSIATRFHNAFVSGYRAAAESVISFVLFFVEYGPSLLIWLLFLAPMLWLTWRRWRRSMAVASSMS
jgi:hypothetical protein